MNSIFIFFVGNSGGEPELRYSPKGEAWATMRVAVSVSKSDTVWVTVKLFGKAAEAAAEKIAKGDRVMVAGRLGGVDAWLSKDGQPRAGLVVLGQHIGVVPRSTPLGDDLPF